MPNVQLSAQIKKLAKDFVLIDGKILLSTEKLTHWLETFDKVEATDRPKLAKELIALAIRFEREGKATAAIGTAQLYACAAGVLSFDGSSAGPVAPKGKAFAPKAEPKPAAAASKRAAAAASKPAAAAKKPAAGKPPAAKSEKSSGGWGAKSKR